MTATPSGTIRQQLLAIQQLHSQFTANEIQYWLFGGWAVDFHAGRITRNHADIDLAVWQRDIGRIAALLGAEQWHRTPDGVDGVVTYERDDVRAEIALLARDAAGIIYTPIDGGRGDWPQGAFGEEIAALDGVHARVIERAALIEEKTAGYGDAQSQAKDRMDVAVLGGSEVERGSSFGTAGDHGHPREWTPGP